MKRFAILFGLIGLCGGMQQTMALSKDNQLLDNAIEAAMRQLEQDKNIKRDQIKVEYASEVLWHDGSLGCPSAGKVAIQVLTKGFLVTLNYNSKLYQFHGNQNATMFHCKNPQAPYSKNWLTTSTSKFNS